MIRKLVIPLYERIRMLTRPAHWSVVRRDRFPLAPSPRSDADHLLATVAWLCRAHDAADRTGVSAGYFFRRGWMPPYPETTGYIIPTLLDAVALCGPPDLVDRARRMGDWEIDIQLPSGAVRGGRAHLRHSPYPIVFNTGQVILGWLALFRALAEERYLAAARKAADWLLDVQEEDGKWSRHTYMDVPHAYHSRVAWPLLELAALTGEERYRQAGRRQVEWVLSQRDESGWFTPMELVSGQPPPTHTIAYTLRGLLESRPHLEELATRIDAAIAIASEHLLRALPDVPLPLLPGSFTPGWRPVPSATCLTGDAQLSILWQKLSLQTGQSRYTDAARRLLDLVKAGQILSSPCPDLQGGVAGSYPIWGEYLPHAYPNWAAKFHADALLLAERIPPSGVRAIFP